jgi:hypothetical protein
MAAKKPLHPNWKYAGICRIIPFVAAASYILSSYYVSQSLNTRDLSPTSLFLLNLSVVLPIAAIWVIAMRGALQLKQYSIAIKKTADGEGLEYVANALIALVLYVIALPLLRSFSLHFEGEPLMKLAVCIDNYVPVLIMAVMVGYLYAGAIKLNAIVRRQLWTRRRLMLIMGLLSLLAALFLVYFASIVSQLPGDNNVPRFVLSTRVLVASYALPQAIVWLVGCLACFRLAHYSLQTPGRIYKKAFQKLNAGILIAIGCIFLAQLLILSPVNLANFNFGVVLIYSVLLIATFGFVLLGRGASKLLKIEEVG